MGIILYQKGGTYYEISDKRNLLQFYGGCNGNLQGISHLVEGMKIDDAISKLKGIRCGFKPTSCPDQLARALEEIKNGNQ